MPSLKNLLPAPIHSLVKTEPNRTPPQPLQKVPIRKKFHYPPPPLPKARSSSNLVSSRVAGIVSYVDLFRSEKKIFFFPLSHSSEEASDTL